MINNLTKEKTYFSFTLGKYRLALRQCFLWRDKHTGRVHMNKRFSIEKAKAVHPDYAEYEYVFEFYTGWNHPCFVYDTIEYEGNRHNLRMSLGWGTVYMFFPWRNRKTDWEDVNSPQPKYGFYLYSGNEGFFDTFVYYRNRNGRADTRSMDMPWHSEFYRHSVYLDDGTWWTMLERERREAGKKGNARFDDPRFFLPEDSNLIYREKHPFRYTTKSGEVQETTATCFIDEREWRPRWFMWTRLFNHVSTVVSISFADEMGNRRGSWKGGVLGVSAPMTRDEKDNRDIKSALSRYEREVNMTHDFCG